MEGRLRSRAPSTTRFTALLAAISICLLTAAVAGTGTAAAAGPCATGAAAPQTFRHVIWIVFENKDYGSVMGSPNAPYINSLAHECGLATNFFAITHPSLPNYIAMTSGGTQGITDDAGPSSHPLDVPSIFSQLGSDWRALQESMPSNCLKSNSGLYAVRHNPAAYYTNIDCAAADVPLTSPPDLSAAFTFVTPDLCNDMHDCSVQTGDTWLSGFLSVVLASPGYQAGDTVVFVTWDEGSSSLHVPTLVVSPYTAAGTEATGYYDHYSLLRTAEELLGLQTLGNASAAPSLRSAFGLKGFYPRPKGASPLRVPLVPAFQRCTSGHNRTHGAPLSYPSCTPPTQASSQLTVGAPDANGKAANGTGSVTLKTLAGNPSTQADEADVQISTSLTDVRRKSDLADYTGEVQTVLYVRLTDRVSAAGADEPQSVQQFPFNVSVPCGATTSSKLGASCSMKTTADSIVSGAVTESKRSVWELRRILVYDGGPDGDADTTADNTLFETEGVFVP
jgi:hypothetical protein